MVDPPSDVSNGISVFGKKYRSLEGTSTRRYRSPARCRAAQCGVDAGARRRSLTLPAYAAVRRFWTAPHNKGARRYPATPTGPSCVQYFAGGSRLPIILAIKTGSAVLRSVSGRPEQFVTAGSFSVGAPRQSSRPLHKLIERRTLYIKLKLLTVSKFFAYFMETIKICARFVLNPFINEFFNSRS